MGIFRPKPVKKTPNRPLFWRQVFEAHDLDPRTVESRTRIAWRITRFLAILQGRILPEQPLSNLQNSAADDLQAEADIPKSLSSAALAEAPKRMLEILQDTRLPLVPPRPDQSLTFEENQQLEEIYDRFHKTLRGLKKYMPSQVSYSDPFVDSRSWYGLLDQHRCFALYPDISEIVLFEENLVQRILRVMSRNGPLQANRILRMDMCLSQEETRIIELMARRQARQLLEMDQEDERAIMTLRLHDHQRRARQAANLREELQGMKQEAIVRGLTKTQPEGFMDVFARVVSETDKAQGQLQPYVQPYVQPPVTQTEPSEATEDEEESEDE